MIQDFKVSGFRHFKNIELTQLRRVNLFVGKNSAGKSALLEAFVLFFSQMSPKYLPEIHSSRQENWNADEDLSEDNPLRHLFFGHTLPEVGKLGFSLASTGDDRSLEIRIKNYHIEIDGPATTLSPIPDGVDVEPEFLEPCLVISNKLTTRRVTRLSRYNSLRRANFHPTALRASPSVYFIPTKGISDRDLAMLWDSISLTDAEKDVISGLKLIEPDVEGLAFVGSDSRTRVALVKVAGSPEPVSLKSLGDGMSRILQIILSLVNAKNNVLIIDEFENGLHWSVQAAVWSLVFKLSERLNVQVFATTHSRDCIESFEKIWSSDRNVGYFARVQKKNGEATVREYNFDLLKDSIETDVEVR
ncbi:AAA family ATPase [Pseudomonas triticifolii]|uniref:AAA family ATPase n=1 Tax=Pseudomonas triticifolii TaxID=2762592 RepID=A0ABR7BKF8_9PSED|nr:AAA family ATPase [Pseudomonas triticifolii]MBC3957668.1 AAA family ATPase [Pseudomonas triticifolii]